MVGGEAALTIGNGDRMKVRRPAKVRNRHPLERLPWLNDKKGCAIVLQGRYIEHQALRALNSRERITLVTSFRPRTPIIHGDIVLNTVRPVSKLPDLYGQVMEY